MTNDPDYEVIVINDGAKDATLQKLIDGSVKNLRKVAKK